MWWRGRGVETHNLLGELYQKVETDYVPKLREDKKKTAAAPKEHKRRGERGMYSKADLAFEEKLRKELEEKKKKEEETVKPKYSEAELKVLAKESETRANATKVRANISNALKVFFLLPSLSLCPFPSFSNVSNLLNHFPC